MNSAEIPSSKKPAPKAYELGGHGSKFPDWRGLMFSICYKTGNQVAYPYAYVQRIEFNKSGKLVIEMTAEAITIEGLHLIGLYYALVDHQVRAITEADAKYQAALGDGAYISKILVFSSIGSPKIGKTVA